MIDKLYLCKTFDVEINDKFAQNLFALTYQTVKRGKDITRFFFDNLEY